MGKGKFALVVGVLSMAGALLAACAGSAAVAPTNQQPVQVVSVVGPLPPINPGGPVVEITLKNVSAQPIVSLAATLELSRAFGFEFDVSASNPMPPGKTVSAKRTLIGGGFSDSTSYPLRLEGALQDGASFAYAEQVQVKTP